jgi:hypothetical protein
MQVCTGQNLFLLYVTQHSGFGKMYMWVGWAYIETELGFSSMQEVSCVTQKHDYFQAESILKHLYPGVTNIHLKN